jgi:hypothetical protein
VSRVSEQLLQQFIAKVAELQQGRSDIDRATFEQIVRELGLSEEDLGNAEREAEKRLTQGRAFRTSELLDRAVEALDHAHALSPFRQDITRELAVTLLTRFREHGRAEDRERAELLLEANIEQDERNTTNYELLRQVQALGRPAARRRLSAALGLGLVAGALATVGVQHVLPARAPVAPTVVSQTVDAKQEQRVDEPPTVADEAPTITRIDPVIGPAGQTVTVRGTNFVPGSTLISVGGVSNIQPFADHEPTQIQFAIPAAASGTTPVVIRTPAGEVSSFVDFTVGMPASPPFIAAISPASGPAGTWLYVHGSDFVSGHTTVSYAGISDIQPTVYSADQLAFTIPPDATESSSVTVSTPSGDSTSTAVFRLVPE